MPGENQDKLMSGNQPAVQYAAFLAIDWADQKHVWSLQEANSSARERGEVDHMPEAVETWVAQLSQRFAGRPIAVAVEQRSEERRVGKEGRSGWGRDREDESRGRTGDST